MDNKNPLPIHGDSAEDNEIHRRAFLKRLAGISGLAASLPWAASAALPKAKITRVRIYKPQDFNPTFNQSNMVVTVETDIGLTGVGEGGTKDLLEQCAGSLIGQDPFRIELIWHEMYKAWFYPLGREKIHAQGAWIWPCGTQRQGPRRTVHQLLGGMMRNHPSAGTGPPRTTAAAAPADAAWDRARVESGFRAFRLAVGEERR